MESTSVPRIKGKVIDDQTRCEHYHSPLDVIAIKFKCCGAYYPCFTCHEEDAGHVYDVWTRDEFNTKAILCGVCGLELTIHQYLGCGNQCPACRAGFNPNCNKHYHLYFEA